MKGTNIWTGAFRNQILAKLEERDKKESKGYTELFQHRKKFTFT